MKRLLLFLLLGFAAGTATAQNILLRDGTTVATRGLRREGDTLMAVITLPSQPGQPANTGEVGYPLAQVARVELPEPPQFKVATDLAMAGKADRALAELEPAVRFYEGLRDVPGSWWMDAELLKMQLLASLGRDDEAAAVGERMARSTTDPESARAARVFIAAGLAHKGDEAKAIETEDEVLDHGTRPAMLASAAIVKGRCHLARKEWEPALLAFLETPVFYPQQTLVMPLALLGEARAFTAMEDFTRAKAALNEITAHFGATPEAADAKNELARIAKLEKNRTPPQNEN